MSARYELRVHLGGELYYSRVDMSAAAADAQATGLRRRSLRKAGLTGDRGALWGRRLLYGVIRLKVGVLVEEYPATVLGKTSRQATSRRIVADSAIGGSHRTLDGTL
jgi:hypothetical protein